MDRMMRREVDARGGVFIVFPAGRIRIFDGFAVGAGVRRAGLRRGAAGGIIAERLCVGNALRNGCGGGRPPAAAGSSQEERKKEQEKKRFFHNMQPSIGKKRSSAFQRFFGEKGAFMPFACMKKSVRFLRAGRQFAHAVPRLACADHRRRPARWRRRLGIALYTVQAWTARPQGVKRMCRRQGVRLEPKTGDIGEHGADRFPRIVGIHACAEGFFRFAAFTPCQKGQERHDQKRQNQQDNQRDTQDIPIDPGAGNPAFPAEFEADRRGFSAPVRRLRLS